MKALVVDDDLITRIVQEILSGYAEVHSCVDGNEAVLAYKRAIARGEPFDLVCMDVLMPVMGGIEALRLIRREEELHGRIRPRATKVVITTATDDKNTISQAFREPV
jgi:two-component system chemotaxis response regulator CheY